MSSNSGGSCARAHKTSPIYIISCISCKECLTPWLLMTIHILFRTKLANLSVCWFLKIYKWSQNRARLHYTNFWKMNLNLPHSLSEDNQVVNSKCHYSQTEWYNCVTGLICQDIMKIKHKHYLENVIDLTSNTD